MTTEPNEQRKPTFYLGFQTIARSAMRAAVAHSNREWDEVDEDLAIIEAITKKFRLIIKKGKQGRS